MHIFGVSKVRAKRNITGTVIVYVYERKQDEADLTVLRRKCPRKDFKDFCTVRVGIKVRIYLLVLLDGKGMPGGPLPFFT